MFRTRFTYGIKKDRAGLHFAIRSLSKLYPVLPILFSKYTMGDKVLLTWYQNSVEKKHCNCNTRECKCDLELEILNTPYLWTIQRTKNHAVRTNHEMYMEGAVLVASKVYYRDGILVHDEMSTDKIAIRMRAGSSLNGNYRVIRPYMPYRARVANHPILPVPELVLLAYKNYNITYMEQYIMPKLKRKEIYTVEDYVENVWLDSARPNTMAGIPWNPQKEAEDRERKGLSRIPKLQFLAMRKLSCYNIVFGGNMTGPFTVRTDDNMLSQGKVVQALNNLDQKTSVDPYEKHLHMHTSRALADMYDYMGITDQFHTHTWRHKHILEKMVGQTPLTLKVKTSAGIRPGMSTLHDDMIPDVVCHVGPNGKKGEQMQNAREELESIIARILLGVPITDIIENFSDRVVRAASKSEHKNVFFTKFEDQVKARLKVRYYYIPSTLVALIDYIMHGMRQKVERGRMIKVGMRWRKGGAYHFAKQMHWEDPLMVYGDGDFRNFDTTIKAKLLLLYNVSAALFIKFCEISEDRADDETVFFALLELVGELLAHNVVHIFDDIYVQLLGTMLSGKIQTSNGDSWITGFLFFMFVQHLIALSPEFARLYKAEREAGRVEIPVYGDDHIIATREILFKWLNELGFSKYCSAVWHMYIRDVRDRLKFLSKLDGIGGLEYEGVVFLKRYMVSKDDLPWMPESAAPVLPYCPLKKYIISVAYGTTDRVTPLDFLLACIGTAHDNMGVNIVAHEFIEYVYNYISLAIGITDQRIFREMYEKAANQGKVNITKLMAKANMSYEEVMKGFPTLTSLVNDHEYDPIYHMTTYKVADLVGAFPTL